MTTAKQVVIICPRRVRPLKSELFAAHPCKCFSICLRQIFDTNGGEKLAGLGKASGVRPPILNFIKPLIGCQKIVTASEGKPAGLGKVPGVWALGSHRDTNEKKRLVVRRPRLNFIKCLIGCQKIVSASN
jgi:hypothetical protein